MKITIESTDTIVELRHNMQDIPARIWEGTTESGVPVIAFITRISPQTLDAEANERFATELKECRKPTYEPFAHGINLRFFID